MSGLTATRVGTALLAATAMFAGGMVVAHAADPGGGNNTGPAGGDRALTQAVPNAVPVPAFAPNPQSQVFHTVAPCRIVDTRLAGGRLTKGTSRDFVVSGNTGFAAQGGAAAGCGIPTTATAVSFSIVAVNPSTSGYLTAWPVGVTRPLASVLNYVKGTTANTGQMVSIKSGANPALSVYSGSGTVDVVIDVYGYVEPQTHLIILADGRVWYGNATHATNLIHTAGSGSYTLTFDRSLTGCNVIATDNGDQTVRAAPGWGGNSLTVTTYKESGGTFTQGDQSFQIFIAC